jgi:hypothetical protein
MNDLDARARAIVDAARDGDNPTQRDRERIRRGVAVQIAAGAVVVSTAAAAGTMSLATKVGLVVATVAVVGGGSVGAHRIWHATKAEQARRAHPVTTARAPHAAAPATMAAPATAEVAAMAAPLPSSAAPEIGEARSVRSEKSRRRGLSSGGRAEGLAVDDSLNAEVAVLGRAREELRLGKATGALAALAEYDRRFGEGMLGEERSALAAIATCQAQPGPAARVKAEAFIRAAPSSPLLERVREACARAADAVRP